MSTETTIHRCSSPACKSATPGGCSDCALAYDCARQSAGYPLAWPLVALALVSVVAIAIKGFGI